MSNIKKSIEKTANNVKTKLRTRKPSPGTNREIIFIMPSNEYLFLKIFLIKMSKTKKSFPEEPIKSLRTFKISND